MNELVVNGWFYLKTDKTTNEEAVREFRKACAKVGIDADNICAACVRDEDGDDITVYEERMF